MILSISTLCVLPVYYQTDEVVSVSYRSNSVFRCSILILKKHTIKLLEFKNHDSNKINF